MLTFLVDRVVPAHFSHEDPATVSLHARWAVDAYKKVGAFWLGGVVTQERMYSLVTAEREADLHEYGRTMGIPDGDIVLRQVIRPLGPYFANPSQ